VGVRIPPYVKDDGFIPRVARVLNLARRAGMRVVHVKVGFRPNVPEASPRNLFLSAVKASPAHQQFFQGDRGATHSGVAPEPNDLIVTKSRVSAFAGTDLDLLLHANDIDTLVLLGIATCGVVLFTSVDAFDADYRLVIVKDCCADSDTDGWCGLVHVGDAPTCVCEPLRHRRSSSRTRSMLERGSTRSRQSPGGNPAPGAGQSCSDTEATNMRFIHLFLAGYFVLVVGIGLASWQIGVFSHLAPIWIGIGVLAAVGIGIMLAVSSGKPTVTEEIQK